MNFFLLEFLYRLASVQEQRLPGTGPESSVDESPRSAENHSMNKVRFQSLNPNKWILKQPEKCKFISNNQMITRTKIVHSSKNKT